MVSPTAITWPFYWCAVKTGAGLSRGPVPMNARSCSSGCLEQDVSTSSQHRGKNQYFKGSEPGSAPNQPCGAIPVKGWDEMLGADCTLEATALSTGLAGCPHRGLSASSFTKPAHQHFLCTVAAGVAVDNLVLLSLLVELESRAGGHPDPCRCVQKRSTGSIDRPGELLEQRSFCRDRSRIWTSF